MKYIVAAGSSFSILPYVIATKLSDVDSISTVVARNAVSRRDKLLRTALSYDLAHAQIPRWREESERIQRRQERRGQRMAKDNKDKTSGQGLKSELDAPFLSRQDVLGQVSWDALCALGVRVYAKGAAVTITWQDDRDSEEGDETAEEEGELDLADDKAEAEEQTAGKGSDDEKTGEAL